MVLISSAVQLSDFNKVKTSLQCDQYQEIEYYQHCRSSCHPHSVLYLPSKYNYYIIFSAYYFLFYIFLYGINSCGWLILLNTLCNYFMLLFCSLSFLNSNPSYEYTVIY